jgi:hypothetical protein
MIFLYSYLFDSVNPAHCTCILHDSTFQSLPLQVRGDENSAHTLIYLLDTSYNHLFGVPRPNVHCSHSVILPPLPGGEGGMNLFF